MKPGSHRLRYVSKALRWLPPELPGKGRLARRLLGSSLQARDIRIDGRHGVAFLTPGLSEPVGFYLLVDGVYEAQAVKFVLKQLRPGAVFVDVGANIGVFALPAAREVGPTGCVIAIEASARVFPYLQQNVSLNQLRNVWLVQCAASNRDGETAPFYEAPVEHFGMGSLGAQFHSNPIPVPARTLDEILKEQRIDKVDLIKVDVEGFEAAVFQGAERLLTSDKAPIIVFEFCDWAENRVPGGQAGQAQNVVKDWGYRLWRLGDIVRGRPPLAGVLTNGFETLVGIKNSLTGVDFLSA